MASDTISTGVEPDADVVIIGGGIAGVSLAEEVHRLAPNARVLILSASRSLRGVRSVIKVTSTVESLEIEEVSLDFLAAKTKRAGCRGFIDSRFGHVTAMDVSRRQLTLSSGDVVRYGQACAICTGARPRGLWLHFPDLRSTSAATATIHASLPDPVVIRDTNSVRALGHCLKSIATRVKGKRVPRVLLVGNGPIACELALALRSHHQVLWAMRDGYAGRSLLDASASRFFLESLGNSKSELTSAAAGATAGSSTSTPATASETTSTDSVRSISCYGNALGPRWVELLLEVAHCAATTPSASSSPSSEASTTPQERDIPPKQSGSLDQSSCLPGIVLLRERELVSCRLDERIATTPAKSAATAATGWVTVSDKLPSLSTDNSASWGTLGVQCLLRGACPSSDTAGAIASTEDGLIVSADIIVAAVGVTPHLPFCPKELVCGPDGGLVVNKAMQVHGGQGTVFAAGDAASVGWNTATVSEPRRESSSLLIDDHEIDLGGDHWFQMRLWTQARVLGAYAGARIAAHSLTDAQRGRSALSDLELEGGYNLDLFAHCTSLGGFKVVLLGRFNGQGLGSAFEEAVRGLEAPGISDSEDSGNAGGLWRQVGRSGTSPLSTPASVEYGDDSAVSVQVSWLPGHHYMKLVLQGGKVVGAVLIGETDMEEAAERLIQGGHELGDADLTDPDLDIDAILD